MSVLPHFETGLEEDLSCDAFAYVSFRPCPQGQTAESAVSECSLKNSFAAKKIERKTKTRRQLLVCPRQGCAPKFVT